MGGIYIHIPFCGAKCSYCDFFSVKMSDPPFALYADRIVEELSSRTDELTFDVNTIYYGGGTPSLLPSDIFFSLSERIVNLIPDKNISEFTIEVNPDDVTPEKVSAWRDAGVNRISVGVQSMVDAELKAVGRRHTASTVRKMAGMLSEFKNRSADIIFGLPGQTVQSLEYSLKTIINMGFTHISAYNLMFEPGTILTHRMNKGLIKPADDELILNMYDKIRALTSEAGFEHYEISNYALPGFQSQHNNAYWSGVPYIGLGPGAHSYDGVKIRRGNCYELRDYLDGKSHHEIEILTPYELNEEYILTRMRTSSGIPLNDYTAKFGCRKTDVLIERARRFVDKGWIYPFDINDSIRLTETGVMMSDSIILSLSE